jgi:Na+/phosphate symporter
MVANALLFTVAVFLGLAFWLMGELKYMAPYKTVLFHYYWSALLIYVALLFVNAFSLVFVLNRKFFLKDTGRKLSHLDKQLHLGQADVPAPPIDEDAA